MVFYYLFLLVVGLAILVLGSDILVRKAYLVACVMGVREFIVGILLLGMGTSAPEWAISTLSALKDLPHLALGNVLGSNIFNILVVFSLFLLNPYLNPYTIIQKLKKDFWFLILTSLVLLPVFWDYFLSLTESVMLFVIFISYVAMCFYFAGSSTPDKTQKNHTASKDMSKGAKTGKPSITYLSGMILLGFALLIGGSYLTLHAAVALGKVMQLSERVIGIVFVSVGSSLPEFITCIVALYRKHQSMAMGNIIGSNIFNTYAVLSTAGMLLPASLDAKTVTMDLPVLLIMYAFLTLLFLKRSGKKTFRLLALIYIPFYIIYIALLL